MVGGAAITCIAPPPDARGEPAEAGAAWREAFGELSSSLLQRGAMLGERRQRLESLAADVAARRDEEAAMLARLRAELRAGHRRLNARKSQSD